MRIIAIIPARYSSSRFPGKPLVDICGKPMIWWVYNQVKKVKSIDEVIVATDDTRIEEVCNAEGLSCIMTAKEHKTSTERLYEVAQKRPADLYICINGDEPLIDPNTIMKIIPKQKPKNTFYVSNLMTKIKNPVEAIDNTNIKVVTDCDGNALFMSRSPIPHPKSSLEYSFYKHVGVLIYDIEALKFFAETPKGKNELVEDINELRFIENGKKLKMVPVSCNTLSVDTPKDLERVRAVIQEKLDSGELKL